MMFVATTFTFSFSFLMFYMEPRDVFWFTIASELIKYVNLPLLVYLMPFYQPSCVISVYVMYN